MIYIIDDPLVPFSRSYFLLNIVQQFTLSRINLFSVDTKCTESIKRALNQALNVVSCLDVVLIPWSVDEDEYICSLIEALTYRCRVIAVIDETNKDKASKLFPLCCDGVITVGCSRMKSKDDDGIIWVPTKKYVVNGKEFDECSIAGAVYAGILAEATRKCNPLLIDLYVTQYLDGIENNPIQVVTI